MKRFFISLLALAFVGLFLFAFSPEKAPDVVKTETEVLTENGAAPGSTAAAVASNYEYSPSADTITNTENDTLTVPTALASLWSYQNVVDCTRLSGTLALIYILEENNSRTGGVWYEVERDTITNAATAQGRLHGNEGAANTTLGWVNGMRQRVIIDGSGTQSVRYTHKATYKRHQ
jgi:hypothetical protein